MTKRERQQFEKDMTTAQRGFDFLPCADRREIIDALHAEVNLTKLENDWDAWDYVLRSLSHDVEHAQGTISKFQTRLAENPRDALYWGDGSFQAAARLTVFQEALRVLPSRGPVAVSAWYLKEVTSRARHVSRSTSASANLIEQYTLGAMAEVVEKLRWL